MAIDFSKSFDPPDPASAKLRSGLEIDFRPNVSIGSSLFKLAADRRAGVLFNKER